MSAIAFDTHTYVKKLVAPGFTERQAEAQAEALVAVIEENLATKRDIESLRHEIELVRRDMKEVDAALRRDMKEMDTRLFHQIELLRKDVESVRKDVLIKLGGIVVACTTILATMIGVVIALIQLR